MGERALFSQAVKLLFLFLCLLSSGASAKVLDYTVETQGVVEPFTISIEDKMGQFDIKCRAFRVDRSNKLTYVQISSSFHRDKLNPPLYWSERESVLRPKSVVAWGAYKGNKHIIALAALDQEGVLTFSYYEQIDLKKFKLTIVKDPYDLATHETEKNIKSFHGDYVGRGDVTHSGSDTPPNTIRDIDFALKDYNRGFELVKSLIICPEGREHCADGKRKSDKYYFNKVAAGFYVEEAKGTLFEKAKPFTLRETGHLQYALWHKNHLKIYSLNYTPDHPAIIEYASWQFTPQGGEYSYTKYVDAVLNKKVAGSFFKAKSDDQYKPQTPS